MTDQSMPEKALEIAIHQRGEALLVDARLLHQFLDIATRFNDWIVRRLADALAVEGEDFYSELSKTTGRPASEYWLTLDLAKELAMLERSERGREVRRYFIQAEKQLRQRDIQPALPQTLPEALRQLADSLEAETRAQEALALAAPKVDAFDALMDSRSTYLVREAAKLLGLGQNRLYTFMRQQGLIIPGTCEPYQEQLDAGRFVVKTLPYMRGTQQASSKTTYVTARGLEYLRRKLAALGVAA